MDKYKSLRIAILIALVFIAFISYAQLGPPPPPPPPPPPDGGDDAAPLGGELLLLIGAGAAYAKRRFWSKEGTKG